MKGEVRASGTYTTHQGEPRTVNGGVHGPTTWVSRPGERAMQQVPTAELGPVERVVTVACWRGGRVFVSGEIEPGVHGFHSDDADLGRREGLYGHQYDGWRGRARVEELTDVVTTVTLLPKYGDPPA